MIVGLGNPGKTYKLTRHNIGYMVIDALAKKFGIEFKKRKLYFYSTHKHNNTNILLAKPITYMNLSGNAVQALVNYYHIESNKLLVICDDINLPFGKIRIREKGSDGGHNGLNSIIQSLHTSNFPRLRVGIGGEQPTKNMVDFVLSEFNKNELIGLVEIIEDCLGAITLYMDAGIKMAMNAYN